MKVSELIEFLKLVNQDAKVYVNQGRSRDSELAEISVGVSSNEKRISLRADALVVQRVFEQPGWTDDFQ